MFIQHRLQRKPARQISLRQKTAAFTSATALPLRDALMMAQRGQCAVPIVFKHADAAANAAKTFLTCFRGQTMYAVKANPCPDLLRTLWESGIRSFDVASIHEVRHLRSQLPGADLNYMNPVKNDEAIREAYTIHDVRSFSFDTAFELEKILRITGQDVAATKSLTLCLRIRVESTYAKFGMSNKFGATAEEAIPLLRAAREQVRNLGICFHVGSQSMDPEGHRQGLLQAHQIALEAGVRIDVIDVGGGFPMEYLGLQPPALSHYFEAIHGTLQELPVFRGAQLWAEPGRALCAEYNSIVARVEAVKGQLLYINNGLYGDLHDPARYNWPLDATLIRGHEPHEEHTEYSLYGPTCDDDDFIRGPVKLPRFIVPGDKIWFRTVGAYGTALRTKFNGCNVEVEEIMVN